MRKSLPKVCDCFLTIDHPYIKILGKGNKERLVYINDSVVKIILEYMDKFRIKDGLLLRNHSNDQYSRFGINKIVSKYYDIAKKMPNIRKKDDNSSYV